MNPKKARTSGPEPWSVPAASRVTPILIWGPWWSIGVATAIATTMVMTTTATVTTATPTAIVVAVVVAVVGVVAVVVVDMLRSRWSGQWILGLGWWCGSS
jgi:hypothetical protein